MPRHMNHDKINRRIKGLEGINQKPLYKRNQKHLKTTPKMIKYIEGMCETLEKHGVPYKYIFDEPEMNWKYYREDAAKIINALKTILRNNEINNGNIRVYHNLVKGSDGKKYEYLTHSFKGRPKGFKLLGVLRYESIPKDDFYSWTRKELLREFKGVGQA